MIFVLFGPGGAGKGTVAARLVEEVSNLRLSRSWTTRARRAGEPEDAYVFVDRATFEAQIEAGSFFEWAEFLGHLYGTPQPDPDTPGDLLLEIDIQGARQVRRTRPEATLILLIPPSPEVQRERLLWRGDDERHIVERLAAGAAEEREGRDLADAVVINHEVAQATLDVAAIVESRRSAAGGGGPDPEAARSPTDDRPTRRIVMAQDQTTLMDPPIEGLLDKVDSKFTLVALAARRARQVNSYYNSLGEGLGVVVPPQVASPSGKPLSIAFEEVSEGKATYTRPDPEEVARAEAEAAALALLEGEAAGDGEGEAAGDGAQAEPTGPEDGSD